MFLIGFKDKSLTRFKRCFGELFEDFTKYLKTYDLIYFNNLKTVIPF